METTVLRDRDEAVGGLVERDAPDLVGVVVKRVEALPRGRVPHLDLAIARAGREPRLVGAKGHGRDPCAVSGKRRDEVVVFSAQARARERERERESDWHNTKRKRYTSSRLVRPSSAPARSMDESGE